VTADLIQEFPTPGRLVSSALNDLHVARTGDEKARKRLGAVHALARPWDPPSCPPLLRQELWQWLDSVAGWLNHEYSWGAERVIPACWPAHPHIVHELAALACLRLAVGHALTVDPLEDWHRYAVPTFYDRMTARLGAQPCTPGSHKPWPGKTRYADYQSADAVAKRDHSYVNDAGATPTLPGITGAANGHTTRPLTIVPPSPPDGATP
jgi:hypothetical protein